MTVKSRRISPRYGEDEERVGARTYSTYMFSESTVIRWAIRILRFVAWALLVMSTFGNYVQFAGGWERIYWSWRDLGGSLAAISWGAVAFAVVFQAVFSLIQWGAKAQRWWLLYTLGLLASAIPSFLTYNAWAGPYLTAQIGAAFTVAIIGLAAIGADALPEWVLVG